MRPLVMRALVTASIVLFGCSAGLPSRLAGTMHRMEMQGIDYSGTESSAFVLSLEGNGAGRAVRRTRAVDVSGEDAHERDETVRYDARARWEGPILIVTLEQREPSPTCVEPIVLRCERWSGGNTATAPTSATNPALPGVEWVCQMPPERLFMLGRVALQHVPREGEFLLLGETHVLHVVEEEMEGHRTVETRPEAPVDLPVP
jgi:hypothetical protein